MKAAARHMEKSLSVRHAAENHSTSVPRAVARRQRQGSEQQGDFITRVSSLPRTVHMTTTMTTGARVRVPGDFSGAPAVASVHSCR
ncbi:hypothetical protein MRX96_035292 [Rhipicephalus microplus]